MSKAIIKNNNIYLENFIPLIKKHFNKILKIYFIIAILFIIYFFIKAPVYTAKLSFYTNYSPSSSQTSISLSFLPANLPGLESDNLNFSISDYVNSKKFLQEIVENEYEIGDKNISLINFWGKNYKNFLTINPLTILNRLNNNIMLNQNLSEIQKKSYFARSKLKSSTNFSEDRKTSLNRISIEVKNHSDLSVNILNDIYDSILSYYNEINNIKAEEKKQFIQDRLLAVKTELKQSEKNMILFLETNKEIASPTLTLKKQSLQREIDLQSQLYLSLSDQFELAKIDEKDNTSSIFLLDSPSVSSNKNGISLLRALVYMFILSFLFVMTFHIYKDRKELFLS
tara:strand:+ start:6696 stop:7718 length:1023 start_codon:yes stop_codon:yes gene_type:complete